MAYIYIGFLLAIVINVQAQQKSYDIVLDKFEPFSSTDKDYFDPGTLRVTRKSRNEFVISGNFSFNRNIPNEILLRYEVYQRPDTGEDYKLVHKGESAFCEIVDSDTNKKFYNKMTEFSNLPGPFECPLPKNEYYMKDFPIDDSDFPASLPKGEAYLKTIFLDDGRELFGYKIFGSVE